MDKAPSMSKGSIARRIAKAGVLVIPSLASFLLAATPAPAPTHVSARSAHFPAALPPVNRHLHGATPAVKPEKHDIKHDERHTERGHRPWHSRWDYVGWIHAHRSRGTIVGTVYNKEEAPVPHASVVLRSPRGHYLKWSMKHLTKADSAGHFIMRNVRTGAYRIHASSGKASGNTQATVHPGMVEHETVRI